MPEFVPPKNIPENINTGRYVSYFGKPKLIEDIPNEYFTKWIGRLDDAELRALAFDLMDTIRPIDTNK